MAKLLERIETVFDENELIHIFKEIVKTPSENPGDYEEAVAIKIQNILNENGIPARLVYADAKRPNVYAVLKGNDEGKTVLYNGHLDVVPARGDGWTHHPFSAFEDEDGYIYGRGAADMKSGVAAMLYAAICLKRLGYPKKGTLRLFFNADEERSNKGMKQFLMEKWSADYAIISEPTSLHVAIGHRGAARFILKTRGEAGHSCFVKNPNNAIEKMSRLLPYLFTYGERLRKMRVHDFLGSAISNVNTIRGGTVANIIPDECVVEIDRRVLPSENIEDVTKEYIEVLDHAAKEEGVEYEFYNYAFLGASFIDKEHPLVKITKEIADKYKTTKITSFEATCEAPFFSVEKNIPTIIFGPGSLAEAHVVNEKVHKSEVIIAAKIFAELALKLST